MALLLASCSRPPPAGTPSARPDEARPAAKPNILLILFDDLGYGSVGAYGSTFVKTPFLDGLAREGMRFTRFYANASVCSPTRMGILTGRFPAHFGLRRALRPTQPKGLPAHTPGLGKLFQEAGYTTAQIGKWHVGSAREEFAPAARGFDRAALMMSFNYFDVEFWERGRMAPRPGHVTGVLKDLAVDFIRESARAPEREPFFINLWLRTPHEPLEPPEPVDDPVAAYAALVENADRKIGELLAELDRLELADETLVIVASDNGAYPLREMSDLALPAQDRTHFVANHPLRGGKRHVFEGGIRVPLIVRWPGRVPSGTVNDSVMTGMDFLPTFAEILGVDVTSWQIDGASFLAVLLENRVKPREDLLVWENKRAELVFAARRGDWKLVKRRRQRELYNLAVDPTEEVDRANEHPQIVEDLTQDFARWRVDTARLVPVVEDVAGSVELAADEDRLTAVFSGEGGGVTLQKDVLLDVATDDFTFSTWLKVPAGDFGKFPMVIARKNVGWRLAIDRHARVTLRVRRADHNDFVHLTWPEPIRADRFHHVAFTFYYNYAGPTEIALYLDPEGARPEGLRRPVDGVIAANDTFVVLGGNNKSRDPFLGTLHDVRFYQASLCEPAVLARCMLHSISPSPGV